jgi:DNA-binding NtrC family response regulator
MEPERALRGERLHPAKSLKTKLPRRPVRHGVSSGRRIAVSQVTGGAGVGQELRVLILDESAEFTAALVGELRSAGYTPISHQVVSIESMSFALDDAAWDLVIGDYSMPSFMAAGALEIIRAKGLEVPLILLSANLAHDVALTALRNGVDDYLHKSHLRWIGAAVERTLREAAERRGRRRAEKALRDAEHRLREAHSEWESLVTGDIGPALEE